MHGMMHGNDCYSLSEAQG